MKPPAAVNEISEDNVLVEAMATRTKWPSFTDEEPDLRRANQEGNFKEDMLPDEDLTNRDLEPGEEEAPAAETIQTKMAAFATFAKFKDIRRKNAVNESRRINLVKMLKDKPTGQGSTSWTRIWKQRQSTLSTTKTSDTKTKKAHLILPEFNINQEPQPFPSNSRVFSNELDDSPHSSS